MCDSQAGKKLTELRLSWQQVTADGASPKRRYVQHYTCVSVCLLVTDVCLVVCTLVLLVCQLVC